MIRGKRDYLGWEDGAKKMMVCERNATFEENVDFLLG